MNFFIERYSPILSILLLAVSVAACESAPEPVVEEEVWFNEVGEAVGLDFIHARADEIRFYFPEIMSGGAGWIDYNNDGWMDLYLVQGGKIGDENTNPFRNTLYRNVNGASFEDVSKGGRRR